MNKYLLIPVILSVLLAGCGTGDDKAKLESFEQALNNVQSRLEKLEFETTFITEKVNRLTTAKEAKAQEKAAALASVPLSDKDVQTLLKNAGFYNGAIDGKIGPRSIEAIKSFQKANGLNPDGTIGEKTKALLIKQGNSESY